MKIQNNSEEFMRNNLMGSICSKENLLQPIGRPSKDHEDELTSFLLLNHFKFIATLGKGAFAKVVLVQRKKTKEYFAIKLISKDRLQDLKKLEYLKTERNVLINFQNPYIIKLFHIFESQNNICFVLEFMQGGPLSFHIISSQENRLQKAKFFAAEVLLALETLHVQGLIYRDLKPDNILIDKAGHIRLADFNLSTMNHDLNCSLSGTPAYAAPEIYLGDSQGVEVDFWAFGILIYFMIEGNLPFRSENHLELCSKILDVEYFFTEEFDSQSKDLIRKFLVFEPNKRLCDYNIIKNHAFFNGIDWEKAKNKELQSPLRLNFSSPYDLRYFFKKRYSALVINEKEKEKFMNDLSYNNELD